MLTALYHATMYAMSFAAILTMFATLIGVMCWLCITVFSRIVAPRFDKFSR
jgi:hypothetical protein